MSRKNRLLIIDDDRRTTKLLLRIFKGKYDIMTASTGQEGLSLIQAFKPDLILLDIEMPGMNGYETCRKIKGDEKLSMIKVLLVSGHSQLEERLKGYEVGADDYVSKPFDNNELRAKVDVFMKLKRVEEIDSIKSNLLALFSHETRTPLCGIIGMSELLMENEGISEIMKQQVSLIHKNCTRLHTFIEKGTLLSNLKAGMELEYAPESVKQHLSTLTGDRDTKAGKRNICMTLECPEDIELSADWHTLDEVLGYLLDNAVKFTRKDSQVSTHAAVEDGMCVIDISDQGEGIDPEWIHNIFDEFAICDILHHKEGQGLSLAIAKQVVELHSGEISVTSHPGEGAVFTVRIPLVAENDARP